ncbi:PGPGW domain-containing protein [Alcanivorax limicola]|uniref:PGPGW domain-containing protein n=1 Tax=Alcanivorax limicola TaxID=2874102 RepID=UPI001CBAF202|nr:PGPGW domain-containing protein [Alcanivorax limicola]
MNTSPPAALQAVPQGLWDTVSAWTPWLVGSGIALGLASMVLIPWLIIHMPADYFVAPRKPRLRSTLMHSLIWVARNLLGLTLVLLGLILLFLPGQGLLTILLGLGVSTFPGKYRLERAIIRRRAVYDSINWIRRRYKRTPLVYPAPELSDDERER